MRGTGKQVEDESAPSTWLLAWTEGPRGRRLDHHHARHPPRTRRLIHNRNRRSPVVDFPIAASTRDASRCRWAPYWRRRSASTSGKQTGENSLFLQPACDADGWRSCLGGPLFCRLVRYCPAATTRHRHRSPQAPTPANGFSYRHAIGQGRSSGGLVPSTATGVDVDQAIRYTLPEELTLRELRVHVEQTGMRTGSRCWW